MSPQVMNKRQTTEPRWREVFKCRFRLCWTRHNTTPYLTTTLPNMTHVATLPCEISIGTQMFREHMMLQLTCSCAGCRAPCQLQRVALQLAYSPSHAVRRVCFFRAGLASDPPVGENAFGGEVGRTFSAPRRREHHAVSSCLHQPHWSVASAACWARARIWAKRRAHGTCSCVALSFNETFLKAEARMKTIFQCCPVLLLLFLSCFLCFSQTSRHPVFFPSF